MAITDIEVCRTLGSCVNTVINAIKFNVQESITLTSSGE